MKNWLGNCFCGFWIGVIIGLLIALCGVGFAIESYQTNQWKRLAVEHGAGKFIVIDKHYGNSAFRWNDELEDGK